MDRRLDAAACIGCGACVAACPNASAMLFTAGKVAHLGRLPPGQPECEARVIEMARLRDGATTGSAYAQNLRRATIRVWSSEAAVH